LDGYTGRKTRKNERGGEERGSQIREKSLKRRRKDMKNTQALLRLLQ